ncbi:lysophospholipid acyltransferase family protein [uncultured Jatrophihabitans sp.]|uniref:lysophospholipid acyltransferase family protein n=1 Tax=uncultured Jatrophihabitans sp. TaxID=1610747 RepID=UPI0035C9AFC0
MSPTSDADRGTTSDEAQVIPLHGADDRASRHPSGPIGRARRFAERRGRPSPGSGHPAASVTSLPAPVETPVARVDDESPSRSTADRLEALVAFAQRRVSGDYAVDEFGFDPDLTDNAVLPVLRPLYDRWFRVEVNGVHNIPADGGALLVSNHAGGLWALDATMAAVAVRTEHPAHRHLRLLGAELIFRTPVLGAIARKAGATMACAPDAERLLRAGELVGVFPEGFKGIGKPFSERYKLQRFGRGGFVHAALRTGVPIIPVSIIGSEEIHPVLGKAKTLARVLNLPYFPLTPTFPWLGPLGLVPLPSKWYIEFGAPITTDGYSPAAADDPAVVFDLTDQVRETIQSTLYRLLVQRRSVWR